MLSRLKNLFKKPEMERVVFNDTTTLEFLAVKEQWLACWQQLGLTAGKTLFEELLTAYQEPQRHYHTLQHLSECLEHFSQVHEFFERPAEACIALWFHDAIYDVKGKTNEQDSAQWAVNELNKAGADIAIQQRVEQLILATQHNVKPEDNDQRLIVDIDLAILGANKERFAEYEQQVREEYSWVPSLVYNHKRKALLKSFIAHETIFNTPFFRERYEQQARNNLA